MEKVLIYLLKFFMSSGFFEMKYWKTSHCLFHRHSINFNLCVLFHFNLGDCFWERHIIWMNWLWAEKHVQCAPSAVGLMVSVCIAQRINVYWTLGIIRTILNVGVLRTLCAVMHPYDLPILIHTFHAHHSHIQTHIHSHSFTHTYLLNTLGWCCLSVYLTQHHCYSVLFHVLCSFFCIFPFDIGYCIAFVHKF